MSVERCVAVVEIRHGAPSISFFQHPANHMALIEWHPRIGENLQSTWNKSRKEENILQCAAEGQRYRARMLFTLEASNVSVALIYRLGNHEGRVTLESVRKPATVMRTIARQIVLRCGSTRNTAFQGESQSS
ncbi:BZ3501_MvSof-1269-A2-R1_Chr12-1g03323 [Microbotryum saponariae]|nr:BZ3501_MvSof-1269-A2-R1_Chr12-1g03323 [Microbotryum saponariae]